MNSTTQRAFYLRNLHGGTQEEQVAHAAQVIDEVAAELPHLTKFGIASAATKAGAKKHTSRPILTWNRRAVTLTSKTQLKSTSLTPVTYYTWIKGGEQRLWLPETELGRGWEPEAVQSNVPRKESFRLPAYTAASHGGASHADFFFYKMVSYKKRRKTRGFSVTCDRNDPVLARFIDRFYENGHLCFGEPRCFAAPGSTIEFSGTPRPRSKSKPKKQLRYSALARRPFDETDYVYIIRMSRTNYYKIGKSNDPHARLQSLQSATPCRLQLVHIFAADNATAAKEALHRLLHRQRSESEWFWFTPAQRETLLATEAFTGGHFQIKGNPVAPDALF